MSLIATRNLTLRIGGQTVLRDVDIAVERGEIEGWGRGEVV